MFNLFAQTAYSLLKSPMAVHQLVEKTVALGYSSCALTDNEVLFGVPSFLQACEKYHLKPIIGMETHCWIENVDVPVVLLAKDAKGYQQLLCFSSRVNRKEQIHPEDINGFCEHGFVIVEGEGGYLEETMNLLEEAQLQKRVRFLQDHLHTFDLALSLNDSPYWRPRNQLLRKVAHQEKLPLVAMHRVLYTQAKDSELYKIVNCIRLGKVFKDQSISELENRYIPTLDQLQNEYEAEELQELERIEQACQGNYELEKTSLPAYSCPGGVDSKEYLTQLAVAGLKKRFNNHIPKGYSERLKYELKVILDMHFEDYFLIVFDFIRFARRQGIYVGPGRGSAAGSLVSYCLGIVHVDPIQNGLLFERFLNPERISMPDIDTDFPDDRRQEVIDYVLRKYGSDHTAHIVTFGTLGAKQVLRDVGKVLEVNPRDIEYLSKAVPNAPKMTLGLAYKESPRFRQLVESSKDNRRLFEVCQRLEGLPRHTSLHAAGIVMSSKPLNQIVPTIQVEEGMEVTQYTMEYLEDLGLIKMDFLGLRNLTTIDEVCDTIHEQDPTFDIMQIPLNDEKTFKLIRAIDTLGVFQLESDGMQNLLKKMNPTEFNDLVVTVALFRPGPMENIPIFLEAKKHPNQVHYAHPLLEPILKSTYGVFIFQEQIMQAAQVLAGFSLGKADILRKAMSKKKIADLEKLENDFMQGCKQNGIQEQTAKEVYRLILKFAGYGFNKAHSVAYGLIAYQMAYLKANYPYAFYASLLNSVIGADGKSAQYIDECRRKHLAILPPSINHSTDAYILENKALRFPLLGVKNVGTAVVESLLKEREKGPFTDYYDTIARGTAVGVNRRVFENLIDAGAFDEFQESRKSMLLSLDEALNYAQIVQIEKDGQIHIDLGLVSKPIMITAQDDTLECATREKGVLGFNLGEHPIFAIKKKYGIQTPSLASLATKTGTVTGFACLDRVKQHRTKKGDLMAFVSASDESGEMDLVFMPNSYERYQERLVKGTYCTFNGKMDDKGACIIRQVDFLAQTKEK